MAIHNRIHHYFSQFFSCWPVGPVQ